MLEVLDLEPSMEACVAQCLELPQQPTPLSLPLAAGEKEPGCPFSPHPCRELPSSEPCWCQDSPPLQSSTGSRQWGKGSHCSRVRGKPEACPALLLPGKQSGSRRRTLSSMAVLTPMEGALLGAAQCAPFKNVCLVSPSTSQ